MKASIILITWLGIATGFEVYWNAPTFQCRHNYKMDFVSPLRKYGIHINSEDTFHGDSVTLFYDNQLGLYPSIASSGEMKNGGIPQKGDISKHLNKAAEDIEKLIPSKDFNGLGIIDWEAWRPTWEFNWNPFTIYQTKSIELAKEMNPTANETAIKQIAKTQWEKSAKLYMLETLELAKKLRQKAEWGFYLFPDCYNYAGRKPKDFQCSKNIRKGNDKLSFLWNATTALYPSIYVYEAQLDRYTPEQRSWRDNEKLREALRVAREKTKIIPYINYFSNKLLPKEEIWRMLAQSAAVGSSGVLVWGSSASVSSKELCKNLLEYITEVLGPAVEKVAQRSNLCSEQICHSQGKCSFPNDDNAEAWKLFIDETVKTFNAENITCRCNKKYSGRFCEKIDNETH